MTQHVKITLFILIVFFLAGCGAKIVRVDDNHNDPELVRKVANEYFTHKMSRDTDKLYEYLNPSSRAKLTKSAFIAEQGLWANMRIDSYEIISIEFSDADNALITVIMFVSGKPARTTFPFIFEEGGWYRRYPTYGAYK